MKFENKGYFQITPRILSFDAQCTDMNMAAHL